MPIWLSKLQPSPWLLRKLLMLALLVGVGVGSFFYGRSQHAGAAKIPTPEGETIDPLGTDYPKRVVAYIYDEKPIYRVELGEYLIQRIGPDRLEYMINRRLVEMECQKYNITVSDNEVEARFQQDLVSFGAHITEKEFVNSILRRFGKTLFEWKEDVIRPKIMMEQLVKSTVKIGQKDLEEGFEALYGPKVECRMIVLQAGNLAIAQKVLENARKGRDAFMDEARQQFIPGLAIEKGKVPAIHKHFGDKDLEDAAFRLKEGEVSGLIKMKDDTYVILLCEKHLPANRLVSFAQESAKLHRDMTALRVAQKIPEAFAELRKAANPRLLLNNAGQLSSGVVPPPQALPGNSGLVSSQVNVVMPPPPVVGQVMPPPKDRTPKKETKETTPPVVMPPLPVLTPPPAVAPPPAVTPMPMVTPPMPGIAPPPLVTPPPAKKG